MRRLCASLLLMSLGVSACGPVHQTRSPQAAELKTIKRVAVVVVGDEAFQVVVERATGKAAAAGATGGAVGGLLGFAIAGGIAASQAKSRDDDAAKTLLDRVKGFRPHASVAESFAASLRESGRYEVVVLDKDPGAAAPYDAIAEFRIEEWGVRLATPADPGRLAGFVTLQARLARSGSDDVLWREHDTVLGQQRLDLWTLRSEEALLRTELQAVALDAGRRMALRMLYPMEGSK